MRRRRDGAGDGRAQGGDSDEDRQEFHGDGPWAAGVSATLFLIY